MGSRDFVYDLLDKLEKDNQEYLIVLPVLKKKDVVIDINFFINNEDSIRATIMTLERVADKLRATMPDEFDDQDSFFLEEEEDSWEEIDIDEDNIE